MQENELQNRIRLAIGRLTNVRLFRNNVGLFKTIDGRSVRTGLCVGSSDLIGFTSKIITPDMVGQKVAIFTAIEVKTTKGKISDTQYNFINLVANYGGISSIVRSVDAALDVLK
jgi:hypothetical protein